MENLYLVVKRQFPEFVREQFPTFIEFVKEYYKWMGENYSYNYAEITDIDSANAEFIEYFRKQLDTYGLLSEAPDDYLKFIKQFYVSKGSEQALTNILRIVYNTIAEVEYPSENVLHASKSKWYRESFITITPLGVDYSTVPSTIDSFTIRYSSGNTLDVSVVSFEELSGNRVRLAYVPKNNIIIEENLVVDIKDSDGNTEYLGYITTSPAYIIVDDPGAGWQLGQVFRIPGTVRDTLARVTRITSTGGMVRAEIISFGKEHTTLGYQGAIFDGSTTLGATAEVTLGFSVVANLLGRWQDDSSIISNQSIRLQDNFFYQQFSYNVVSSTNPAVYNRAAKILHPGGAKLFTTFVVDTEIVVEASVVTSFPFVTLDIADNVNASDATTTSVTFTRSISDSISPDDAAGLILPSVDVADSVSVTTAEGGTPVDVGAYALEDYFAEDYSISEKLLTVGV